METTLLLLHTETDGTVGKAGLEALSAALELDGELHVGLAGAQTREAANQIGGCGASRFLAIAGEAFGQPRFSTDAAAAEALCRASGAAVVIAPAPSRWSRALPGV